VAFGAHPSEHDDRFRRADRGQHTGLIGERDRPHGPMLGLSQPTLKDRDESEVSLGERQ